jgi:hypothetical protein
MAIRPKQRLAPVEKNMRSFRFARHLFLGAISTLSVSAFCQCAFAEPAVTAAPVPGGAATPAGSEVKVQVESLVSEGPMSEERGLLLKRINAAKAQGIGIAGYMNAFKYVEELAKTNAPSDKLKERIDAVNKGLDEQSKRAVDLKNRPPATAYDGGSGGTVGGGHSDDKPSGSDIASQLKGQNPDSLLDKLKAKYGDRIPQGTDVEALKKQFMGDDRAKDILKKLGQ